MTKHLHCFGDYRALLKNSPLYRDFHSLRRLGAFTMHVLTVSTLVNPSIAVTPCDGK